MNPKDKIGREKPSMSFVPARPLLDMAEVMQHGALKYEPFNWRDQPVAYTVYLNAAFRHLFEMLEGRDTDKDSGLPHSAHVMACMAILRDAQHMDTLDDDRLGMQTPLGRPEEKVVGVATNPMTCGHFP